MSDFQDNAPVQLKPIKACAQIIAERDRYREALEQAQSENEYLRNALEAIAQMKKDGSARFAVLRAQETLKRPK